MKTQTNRQRKKLTFHGFASLQREKTKKRNPDNMDIFIDSFFQLQQKYAYCLDLSCMKMLVSGQREVNVKEKVQAKAHQALLPALQGLFFSLPANLLEKRAEYEEIDEFSV